MSAALTDEMILVAVLSGLASLGIGLWANRQEIGRIEDRLWGPKRGVDGAVDSLGDHLERIEEKIGAVTR